MSITVRHIVNPTEAEIERCTDVIYEAFGREYFKSSLGVKDEFVRPCARAHLMSGVIGGEIHVAELPGVGIVGVAMWFRPGQKMLSTAEHRAAGWDDLMSKVGDEYSQWWTYFLKVMSDMPDKYYGNGVQRDSYHLQLLGVHPDYQKQGAGTPYSTLLSQGSAVLETCGDFAVAFYTEHMKYKVFGPDTLDNATGGGGFPAYWFQKKFD